MADALASGASSRKGVRVQVPPRPPQHPLMTKAQSQYFRYTQSYESDANHQAAAAARD